MRAILSAAVLLAFAGSADAGRGRKLIVKSNAFLPDADIPAQYTCDGVEQTPPLQWSGVPEGTKSIAILVSDPDTAKGVFTHWIVTGLPAGTTSIDGTLPEGAVEGENDKGKTGWVGPCPPSGKHHYVFRVFALDTKIAEAMTRVEFRDAIAGHVLASGKLIGMYEKRAKK